MWLLPLWLCLNVENTWNKNRSNFSSVINGSCVHQILRICVIKKNFYTWNFSKLNEDLLEHAATPLAHMHDCRWQAFQKLWFPFFRPVCRFCRSYTVCSSYTTYVFSGLPQFFTNPSWSPSVLANPVLNDVLLVCVFGLQHSGLARKRVRSFIERHLLESKDSLYPSFYALSSAVVLLVNLSCWAPVNGTVWSLQSSWLVYATLAVNVTSWCLVFASLLSIHWFELCGGRASSGLLFRKDVVSNAPRCN